MKALRFVWILLLALALVSCASAPEVNPLETGPAEHHFSEGINGIFTPDYDSVGIQGRMIPWNRNASQYAKDTSSLYFYFMAGEETPVEGVGEKIGDSCLAAFPDGTLMLIDANQDGYTPQLVANLKALGVTHLDYVLFSHPHSDHYMGFVNPEGITANFTVGKVYYNGTGNAGHTKISSICTQKGIPMEILKEGDSLTIGGVKIDILNPTEAVSASTVSATEETNNSSICMMFTYGTKKALFTGDMYKSGLTALVQRYGSALDADFLKIPHHGHSETSILDSFASAVSADLALASSGVPLNASVYGCYAKTGRYLFPSGKNKMKKNYELSQRDDFGFIVDQELQRLQRKQPGKKIYIRWNDAGDIYNASYFSKLVSIAWRNMNVNFYSYTKSVKLVKDAIAGGLMIPPNYHITFSFGGKQDDLIQPEDRQAKVFGAAEEAEECWHDASHNDMVTYNEQKICLPYHGIKGRFKK